MQRGESVVLIAEYNGRPSGFVQLYPMFSSVRTARLWVLNAISVTAHPRFIEELAEFARVIMLDKRGTGLSDRVAPSALPTLEQRMDDVRAVMDEGVPAADDPGGQALCLGCAHVVLVEHVDRAGVGDRLLRRSRRGDT